MVETQTPLRLFSRARSPSPREQGSRSAYDLFDINPATHPHPVLLVPTSRHKRQFSQCQRICLVASGVAAVLLLAPTLMKYALLLSFEQTLVPFRSETMETKIDAETTQYCIQNATWTTVNDAPPKLETFSHVVEASFSLPLSSDLLYLVARGALSHGMVQILSSGVAESNYMAVHVSVAYDYAHMLDRIKVCLLQPEEGQRGVGIFSPADLPYPARKYRTHFDVVVQVPAMVKGHPALVKRFESDMPLFSYQVDLPRDAVLFDHLSLSTSNKPIIVNSLATNTAMLHTMNSKIEGAFSTASYLSLHTLSAPIKADVQMLNANDGTQTQLWMQTSHSGINATAELVSTSTHATEGSFKIHGRTSGGLLDISALNAPIDHVLDLTAETSNALASVSLHRTWQGAFHLLASRFFTPAIDADTSSSDPSGGSRHRRVHTKGSKENVVEGYAEWVPKKGQTGGELKVITSNAPLHVTL